MSELSNQAPSTGALRRLLGPLYFTGVLWYRLVLFAVRILPGPLMRLLVGVCTTLFLPLLPRIRHALIANRAVVSGRVGWWRSQARAWNTLRLFAWCMAERNERFLPGREFQIEREGRESWEALLEQGRGGVLVTAHVGSWEVASELPTTREDGVVHLVREEELDPRAQAFLREQIEKHGGARYHTHFATDDPTLGVRLLEALRAGEWVALQGDRPRGGGRSERVPLCGAEIDLPPGPAALARTAGVPLLPLFVFRQGRRHYRIHFCEPIEVARTRDRHQDVRSAVLAFARQLEWAVQRHPEQWFCFNNAFERSPAAAAPSR